MAAVNKQNPHLVSPVGYENVFIARATEAIQAGDPVVIVDAPAAGGFDQSVALATDNIAHGIAIKNAWAGGRAEVAWRGEVDGYSGLTPGAPYTIVDGALDDTPPAEPDPEIPDDVGEPTLIRAVTPTRIRFDLT